MVNVAGGFTAEVLELLCDFGREERDVLEQSPATRPADVATADASSTPAPAPARPRSSVELQWTGRLEITPVETPPGAKPTQENRIHVLAKGSPVWIQDPGAGHATCLELEYHTETEQIWLRGSPDQWVTLQSDPDQQLMGEQIHVDQKARIARMTGAGRLIGRASDWTGEALPGLDLGQAGAGSPGQAETVEITGQASVELFVAT